ncbi:MAG: hypothetical protein R3E01_29630 [Pirellulaceae bacterium]|nr:hypothetical protein [Planctomycetales bacterium]
MRHKAYLGLQLLMWSVCAFHVVVGAGLNVSSGFVEPMARIYGAHQAEWSPQFLYILRPLGVFMLALGVLAGVAASNPGKYRAIIFVFAGIFIVRALQRVFLGQEISDTFGIDASRNTGNMVFFFGLAAVLLILAIASQGADKARSLGA